MRIRAIIQSTAAPQHRSTAAPQHRSTAAPQHRSTAAVQLTAESDDVASARELIEAQVPDGHELLQLHNTMPRGGRVIAAASVAPPPSTKLTAMAPTIKPRWPLRANVPEGWRILAVSSME